MKISRKKIGALVFAVAAPGFTVFGCSGTIGREFRDAAVSGAANFVTQLTFDYLDFFVPDPDAED